MQKVKAERFLSEEEREQIKEATHAAEACTSGEIALVIAGSSDHYYEAEVIGGVILGGILSLILTILFFHSSVWSYIPLNFLLFFPSRLIFKKIPELKAVFVGTKRRDHTVRHSAVQVFHEKGFYRTKKHIGVLFYISLLEKKVWVLADKGVHEKIRQDALDRLAVKISKGIKEGHACEAICGAIKEAGELLARYFPITPDDINELPDGIATD